jgi:MFS family permease
MGVGIGEAGLNPASFSILADLFPKERLGAALSVFYIGNMLGSSLAFIVGGTAVQAVTRQPEITVPLLGTIASWRLTFLILGLPGLFSALLVFTLREPIRKNLARTATGAAHLSIAETVTEIRSRWQSVVGISVGFVFQAACVYGFTAWVPTYFVRAHGWTIGQTGRALGLLILPFGSLGLYLGGWLSERWQKRGVLDALLLMGIPSAIGILVFLVPAMLMPNPAWSLALIGPGFFFMVLPMGTAAGALQLIFPNKVRAQVSALYLFILNLGGLTLGPLMPGVFTDYLFKDPKMIGAAVAMTMAISAILMLLILLATRRPYRTHYLEMNA